MIVSEMQVVSLLSAISGLAGTILIYFFGVPRKIDTGGHHAYIAEAEDPCEKLKIKKYKILGNIGLGLIGFSFVLQAVAAFI